LKLIIYNYLTHVVIIFQNIVVWNIANSDLHSLQFDVTQFISAIISYRRAMDYDIFLFELMGLWKLYQMHVSCKQMYVSS